MQDPIMSHNSPSAAAAAAGKEPGQSQSQRPLRVLIIDEELPYPINSGKRARSLNLALQAAQRHEITYLSYTNADRDETEVALPCLRQRGIRLVLLPNIVCKKSGPRFYLRLLLNLFSRLPYSVESQMSRGLRAAVHQQIQSEAFDLIHCELTPYAQLLIGLRGKPWVLMAHNIESLIWSRMYQCERNSAKRWYIGRQYKKYCSFERRAFADVTRLITVSEEDAERARRQFAAPRVSVVDNGVDVAHFRRDATPRRPNHILFLGSLDWRPNQDAVRILVGDIMPRILAANPRAVLHIVGRRPPAWMVQLAQSSPNVQLEADVADVRPYLWSASVMVVPLRIGGGSRLKILEAAAAECPVVSTRIGAEGLSLTAGRHYLCADEPGAIAKKVLLSLADPAMSQEMAREARQLVESHYDWSALAQKLEAVWYDVAAQRECTTSIGEGAQPR